MEESTVGQKSGSTSLGEKKTSTIEYRALELCGNIIAGYQKRLEEYEINIDSQNVPVSWLNYELDREGLHNSIMVLQLLLGYKCLSNDCQYPRTLETALQEAGIDEHKVGTEKKRCEEYLDRARGLKHKSFELADRQVRLTYDVLTARRRKGETLTSEEIIALDSACEVLAAEH